MSRSHKTILINITDCKLDLFRVARKIARKNKTGQLTKRLSNLTQKSFMRFYQDHLKLINLNPAPNCILANI